MNQIKTCPRCKIVKSRDFFYVHKKDGTLHCYCKECQIEMTALWNKTHKERHNTWAREYNRKHPRRKNRSVLEEEARLKIEVLTYYGEGNLVCKICGFSDIRALSIDHIKEDGAVKRRLGQKLGQHFYRWLKLSNYPEGYQTLCMNCQLIKHHQFQEDKHKNKPDD